MARKALLILCFLPTLLCIPFLGLTQALLRAGVLGRKDCWLGNGPEGTTFTDQLWSVWNWDAMTCLLFGLALPCAVLGLLLVKSNPTPAASPPGPDA